MKESKLRAEVRALVAKNLSHHRKKKEMTLQELQNKTGIAKQQLSWIEIGQHLAMLDMLVRIAKGLGIKPSELFKGIDEL